MNVRKLLGLLLAAALIGMATPLFARQETPKVRLGVQPWLGYGPWWIAEENGYFEDEGLEVEVIDFTWDQDMSAALASSQIDLQAAATNTFIALRNQDIDVQAFLVMDASYEADAILAKEDITSIEDLKGKQVAYELGSTSDLLLNYALSQAGMAIEDIEPVPIAAADAGAALISGSVDIAVTYEPYISAALREREGYKVLYTAAEKPGLISDVMIAQREFIEENPEVIAAVSAAWHDAVTFLRENPEEGGQIIADAVGSPLEEFQVAFEGVQVYDLEENAELMQGDFQESFTTIAEIMMSLNPEEISEVPDPAEVFYVEHLPAVEASQ